jgi:CHAT domain-containing protein/Tfp pilus assembly protein PilF
MPSSRYLHWLVIVLVAGLLTCSDFASAQQTNETSVVSNFARTLLSAKTENEQKAMLEAEPKLVTSELIGEIKKQVDTCTQKGELTQAHVALRLMQTIAEKISDESTVASAVNRIGHIHWARGEYQRALDMFVKHLSMDVTRRDKAMMARALINTGSMKNFLGDSAGALEDMLQALKFSEEVNDKSLLSISLNNLGTIHGSQGNHAQALEYFQRTLKLGQASNDKSLIASALTNIGTTYHAQRDHERGLDYYRQSLVLREELNDKRMAALTLNNMGVLHREQGDYKQAMEYYQQSLTIRQKLEDQAGTATVLNHIANIHFLQGDFTQALQITGQVIDITTRLTNPQQLWRAYEISGRSHKALKQFDEAEKAFTNSIATVEKMRQRVGGSELARQRFFEDKLPPYISMVDLSFSRARPDDALTYAELAKARTLLDVVQIGRVHITKAMTPEELEMERASNAELVALNAQIQEERQRRPPDPKRMADLEQLREKARLAHEALLTTLYVKHPELRVQRGEIDPITTAETAGLIDAGAALLEFVVAEEKSYLLVVTKQRKDSAPQFNLYSLDVTSKELSERIKDFRRMLSDRDLSYHTTARQLYDLLLKPAEQQLLGKKALCIVPDKALWELPFQALQPRAGVHVIEDYSLFYAPSLTVLREMIKKRGSSTRQSAAVKVSYGTGAAPSASPSRNARTLLAFGNTELPESEREVKTLAELYGKSNSRVFFGTDAREKRVKLEAPKYGVLHFATHGFLDSRNPMFSYLALAQVAGDPNEDGRLEAREIVNMDLHAELAVLSACETARGRTGAGEGVVGMSWALFVAGVPTTVASQWKVDSASTTNLMIAFHRRLTKNNRGTKAKETKAESLRQAALVLLRSDRYRHPFYWAGFVMVGDGW